MTICSPGQVEPRVEQHGNPGAAPVGLEQRVQPRRHLALEHLDAAPNGPRASRPPDEFATPACTGNTPDMKRASRAPPAGRSPDRSAASIGTRGANGRNSSR